MVQDPTADDHVDGGIRNRQPGRVALDQSRGTRRRRLAEHARRQIEADDGDVWPCALQAGGEPPGPTSDVQHDSPRGQRGAQEFLNLLLGLVSRGLVVDDSEAFVVVGALVVVEDLVQCDVVHGATSLPAYLWQVRNGQTKCPAEAGHFPGLA